MHRITKVAAIAAAALTALMATGGAASASVTFDPTSGTGFVGKGDVQTPLGWNDAKLQQNAEHVTFSYESTSTDEYEVVCEWDTGSKHIVHHKQTKDADVLDTVAYDARSASRNNPNGKVTGFNLIGLENLDTSADGEIPVVGGACPETGNEEGTDNSVTKLITSVDLLSSTSVQTLSASFGDTSFVIWTPAPVL